MGVVLQGNVQIFVAGNRAQPHPIPFDFRGPQLACRLYLIPQMNPGAVDVPPAMMSSIFWYCRLQMR